MRILKYLLVLLSAVAVLCGCTEKEMESGLSIANEVINVVNDSQQANEKTTEDDSSEKDKSENNYTENNKSEKDYSKKDNSENKNTENKSSIDKDGEYTSKDEVALYIHTYNRLPKNYITKSEAKKLGWNSKEGNLWEVAPNKSIGGDVFTNREGSLPKGNGVKYYECDIDYEGGYRAAERIIFSNKGDVYYTNNHYKSFEKLY